TCSTLFPYTTLFRSRALLRHRQGAGMSGSRLRLVAPTRPARDALYAYLTGLDDEPTGYWAQPRFAAPLAGLRAAAGGQIAIAFGRGGLLQSLDAWQN